MAIALKIIVVIIAFLAIFFMARAYVYGRKCRAERSYVPIHKKCVNFLLTLLILDILAIESSVRLGIFFRAANFVLFLHIIPAVIFLSLFLSIRFKFTGIASSAHKILARICLVSFVVALITGVVLLWSV